MYCYDSTAPRFSFDFAVFIGPPSPTPAHVCPSPARPLPGASSHLLHYKLGAAYVPQVRISPWSGFYGFLPPQSVTSSREVAAPMTWPPTNHNSPFIPRDVRRRQDYGTTGDAHARACAGEQRMTESGCEVGRGVGECYSVGEGAAWVLVL